MASGALEGNLLLNALVRIAPGPWQDDLQWVELPLGKVLHEPHVARTHVYFPVTAVISLLYVLSDGDMAELCLVGSEGVIGMSGMMGNGTTASCALVQCAGSALRLSTSLLRNELLSNGPVADVLMRYTQVLVAQMSQTAVCNRHHTIDQHLCRWLLLMLDRIEGDSVAMTQELIAAILGVRRASVNTAAAQLQKEGLISYGRGRIHVVDRPGLERRACECYAVIKFEYDRLRPALDEMPAQPRRASLRRDGRRLAALRRFAILDTPPEKVFDDIAQRTSRALDVPIAIIGFLDEERDWFKACVGFAATESPADTSFCDVFFERQEDTIVVESTLRDRRFSEHAFVRGMPFIRFYAGVRLAAYGQTVGTLCIYDFKPRRLDAAQVRELQSLARSTMEALMAREVRPEAGEVPVRR